MNLYEYSIQYLKDQTRQYLPEYDIDNIEDRYCRDCDLYTWPPYFSVVKGEETLNDIFKMFAMVLQNRQALPSTIKFEDNYETFTGLTRNFDYIYISELSAYELLTIFMKANLFSGDTGIAQWAQYSLGLVQAARFLRKYDSFMAISEEANDNHDKFINKLTNDISGIGKALAPNFLKEIGIDLGKPDTHLLDTFKVFDSCVDENNFNDKLRQISRCCNVTNYKLDRIIWLICSGKYFKDRMDIARGKKKGALKKRWLSSLRRDIKNGTIEL